MFTAQADPKESERGGDPLAAVEFHRHGIDMSDDDENPAIVSDKVRDKDVCACKDVTPTDEIADDSRQAAFTRIEQKVDQADFQSELSAHIHRSGIAASYFMHVFVLEFCNEYRKIKAPDQVASDRYQYKPIPSL
jgi:hypothetical protein